MLASKVELKIVRNSTACGSMASSGVAASSSKMWEVTLKLMPPAMNSAMKWSRSLEIGSTRLTIRATLVNPDVLNASTTSRSASTISVSLIGICASLSSSVRCCGELCARKCIIFVTIMSAICAKKKVGMPGKSGFCFSAHMTSSCSAFFVASSRSRSLLARGGRWPARALRILFLGSLTPVTMSKIFAMSCHGLASWGFSCRSSTPPAGTRAAARAEARAGDESIALSPRRMPNFSERK
mmetsp:Transcript_12276/g.35794  ORF Transcript_12276/g.35794 Transcript_12276/m.35794 type:complete len:240 (+) Transcript_12276:761-1480(+)